MRMIAVIVLNGMLTKTRMRIVFQLSNFQWFALNTGIQVNANMVTIICKK